jgi:twitching motility protein PilT
LRNGIVLVTGPTSSGKSSTVAALLDRINREREYHIITIEDPIGSCTTTAPTMHQRELHSDTPNFALAPRAAAPVAQGDFRWRNARPGNDRDGA